MYYIHRQHGPINFSGIKFFLMLWQPNESNQPFNRLLNGPIVNFGFYPTFPQFLNGNLSIFTVKGLLSVFNVFLIFQFFSEELRNRKVKKL